MLPASRSLKNRWIALALLVPLVAAGCSAADDQEAAPGASDAARSSAEPVSWPEQSADDLVRLATYPVWRNQPEGEARETETAAEIAVVSDDGNTVVYSDSPAGRIGFLDISDPTEPRGLGTLSLSELEDGPGEPTSVAVVGEHVLVVVDTSDGDFTDPSGRLDVVRLDSRERIASLDLGGQPDSIAISPDGAFAAIAIENQRDEDLAPTGGEEGDLPQQPSGFVQLIDLAGEPSAWTARRADIRVDANAAGIVAPDDLEPEYVAINEAGQVAVTLQENNGIAVLDGGSGETVTLFSAGTATVDRIDTEEDGRIELTGGIVDAPREPDAIAWIDDTLVATANEGDWRGGTRGWSILDTTTGEVIWDAGNSVEHLAVSAGLHNDSRADAKGNEPEGIAVTSIGGSPVALVGSERSNFIASYDISDPRQPRFRQILPTTNGPEGIVPVPGRDLVVVSSEADEAEAGVRSTITIYGTRAEHGDNAGQPAFPTIISADIDGAPIGWGGLGALAADPTDPDRLHAATDNVYSPSRILGVDVSRSPAVIDSEILLTEGGAELGLDIEGIAARPSGGWALAVEGSDGPGNEIVLVDSSGAVTERVPLPDDIADALGGQGLEGIAVQGEGDGETIWIPLQRELSTDPAGATRIGAYTPADDQWSWHGYPLEDTSTAGDWIGVSEIALDGDGLLVLERDKLSGPDARIKRVYRVALPEPGTGSESADEEPPMLAKSLEADLLPLLGATNGWVQEKAEGMAIAGNGALYVVTDNDGLDDATGETVLLRIDR
ncbi:esterase-like activity of phytase family protein [Lolliginicoccus suaedae]|uniref:esterase-like activity of phytase family protein n=1 Tax=Lolliginicoccus suaedae TaxID=2605429 RepID=UPI001F2427A2|nr:esterase-like activity of phytase family protein [Lolliginicoccus suaedae]